MENVPIVLGQYKMGKTLGIGAFGKVKLAVHEITGQKVAIKIVNKKDMKRERREREEKAQQRASDAVRAREEHLRTCRLQLAILTAQQQVRISPSTVTTSLLPFYFYLMAIFSSILTVECCYTTSRGESRGTGA